MRSGSHCERCKELEMKIEGLELLLACKYRKLNKEKVIEMRRLRDKNPKVYSYNKLARIFGVSLGTVGSVLKHETWRHV